MTTPATFRRSALTPSAPERLDRASIEARRGLITVGIAGARRNAAAAVCVDGTLVACCEQERLTRVRGERLEPGNLPEQACRAALEFAGDHLPADVDQYVVGEDGVVLPDGLPTSKVDHHLAHAATAFCTSPFDAATVLVCDRAHGESVWLADNSGGPMLRRQGGFAGPGFATLFSACAEIFGVVPGQEHQIEALARLSPAADPEQLRELVTYEGGELRTHPDWRAVLSGWLRSDQSDPLKHRSRVASAFQTHLGALLIRFLEDVRHTAPSSHLCLGGGLFFNTYFNTLVHDSGLFDEVFVPANPGNAGVAAGAALVSTNRTRLRAHTLSPFLGPRYELEQIKGTLDNCKLSYECLSESEVTAVTVDALRRGLLVGWFGGRMEWGHRALGNRSILASPLSPYVLDNLNVFLKQRQRYRAYGLSILESDVPRFLRGPRASRFMQFEYEVADRDGLRNVLPEGAVSLRVQTIPENDHEYRRFAALHSAFGQATGLPVLVNTSFNGFSEPIVCSPRDAIRVFFGTGIDMLVLDRFVVRK